MMMLRMLLVDYRVWMIDAETYQSFLLGYAACGSYIAIDPRRLTMANEKTLEILKKMKADPKAKELFEGMETPKSLDEMVAAYAQVAEKLGYGITAEDIP